MYDIYLRTLTHCSLKSDCSCRPNVLQEFDVAFLSFTFRALRKIEADEQIFVSYINILLPFKNRQEKLTRYRIICTCTSCTKATPESEKLRTDDGLEPLFNLVKEVAKKACIANALNIKHLEGLTKWRQIFIDEGWQATPIYPILLNYITRVSKVLKLGAMVKQFNDEHLDRTQAFA